MFSHRRKKTYFKQNCNFMDAGESTRAAGNPFKVGFTPHPRPAPPRPHHVSATPTPCPSRPMRCLDHAPTPSASSGPALSPAPACRLRCAQKPQGLHPSLATSGLVLLPRCPISAPTDNSPCSSLRTVHARPGRMGKVKGRPGALSRARPLPAPQLRLGELETVALCSKR